MSLPGATAPWSQMKDFFDLMSHARQHDPTEYLLSSMLKDINDRNDSLHSWAKVFKIHILFTCPKHLQSA